MLKLRDINKSFGDRVVFDHFNIEIDKGEFVVFKGKSGCGKTTLLHMIGGLEKPDGGEVIFEDRNIYDKRYTESYLRDEVGFLLQNFALIDQKTVMQNLNVIKKNAWSGITGEQALEYVGLKEYSNKKVYQLSGGEQQRVAIARLMMKKSSIILADEPTGSLDRGNAEIVIEMLKDFCLAGKTIIMVTHGDYAELEKCRIVEL